MVITQSTDYTLPPSTIVNYMRDKVPFLGTYYILEISENSFMAFTTDPFGRQELFTFSRTGNYGSVYDLTDRREAAELVEVVVTNPLYVYSNVDGVPIQDYRVGWLSDIGIILALSLCLVFSFLGRFKRGTK